MTKEEAIKYLQQLYPHGGCSWLDEQRIEAIGMAVNALQEEPKSKCQGCNNVKGCITCIDGSEWAHIDEVINDDEVEKHFKAGDVVVYVSRHPAYSGLYLLGNPNDLSIGYSNANEPYQIALRNCTVASEDERKQFMWELNKNGYKWNEDALKIEKAEPTTNEFEEALAQEWKGYNDRGAATVDALEDNTQELAFAKGFYRGANWQKEQLKKDRLKYYDSITEEQYNLEVGFIDSHIDKYNRMPTFLDAIEYGMRIQKELMKDLPKWKHICSFQSFTDNNVFIENNCLRWGNRVILLNDLKNLPKE